MLHRLEVIVDLNVAVWQAYVQQLENSKLRLIQLEQELDRVRQQVENIKHDCLLLLHSVESKAEMFCSKACVE